MYINQERFYPGREYEVAPGTKFSYECRKDDYETVTKSYVAREDEYGQNKMLETPLASEWEETPALKAVNELERLYEKLELERSSKKLSKSTIEGVKEKLKAAEKAVANDGNASGPLSGRLKVAAARVETLIALPDSGQQKNYHVKQARSLLESGDAEGFRHYIEAKTLGHKFTDDDMSTLYKYYGPVQAAGELAETYNERAKNRLRFRSSHWRASPKFCKVLDVLSQYGESKRKNDFVQEFERELKSKSNGAYEWFSKGWKDEKINGRETNREKYKIN